VIGPGAAQRGGFTLFEVIVAIAMILALLGIMFNVASDLLEARSRLHEITARQRAATTVIDRVEADLATCLVADGRAGAGVVGDARSLRVLSRGVSLAEAGAPGAVVGAGDLQVAEYRFDADRRVIEGRRRSWSARSSPPPAFTALGGVVHQASFRYHDGLAWRDEFDSLRERRLPHAVEVAVWFDAPPGEEPVGDPLTVDEVNPDRAEREPEFLPTFDEEAVAMNPDRLGLSPAAPDRVRVILILDAGSTGQPGSSSAGRPEGLVP
jgi:type II secretory pathway pseudopilin PulG